MAQKRRPKVTPEYLAANRLSGNFPKRFWAKVVKTDSCWLWQASKIDGGYGQIWRGQPFGGMITAHTASWILHRGPIPKDLNVCHDCLNGDHAGCVNPSHLWLGTHAQNMADKIAKGRTTRGWRNESHKLAPDDADHIRDLRQAGAVTAMELAESYGITRQRVGQICREVVA